MLFWIFILGCACILGMDVPGSPLSIARSSIEFLATPLNGFEAQLSAFLETLEIKEIQTFLLSDHSYESQRIQDFINEHSVFAPIIEMRIQRVAYKHALENLQDIYSPEIVIKYAQSLLKTDRVDSFIDNFLFKWDQAMVSHQGPPKIIYGLPHHSIQGGPAGSIKDLNKLDLTGAHPIIAQALVRSLENPLHPMSDTVILSFFQLETYKPSVNRQVVADLVKTFDTRKVRALVSDSPIIFPTRIAVQDQDYILFRILGKGAYGTAFRAQSLPDDSIPLVVKILKKPIQQLKSELDMESATLDKLGRLIARDAQSGVLVQRYIKGTVLSHALAKMDASLVPDLKTKYLKLSRDFLDQTGYIHGDVRPANVIVDSEGKLHLIDFGLTKVAPANPDQLDYMIKYDEVKALVEFDNSLLFRKANLALRQPEDPGSKDIVFAYVQRLSTVFQKEAIKVAMRVYAQKFKEPFPKDRLFQIEKDLMQMKERAQSLRGKSGYNEATEAYIKALKREHMDLDAFEVEYWYHKGIYYE